MNPVTAAAANFHDTMPITGAITTATGVATAERIEPEPSLAGDVSEKVKFCIR